MEGKATELVGPPAVEGAQGPTVPLAAPAGRRGLLDVMRDYLALTKPRIIVLLLITTVAAMYVADPSGPSLATILWTMLGGYLAAGGAGAINHFVDRDRDARMARTCDRPLVTGRIEPSHGLAFGIALAIGSIALLAATVNVVAAALALSGLLGYVFVYTLWLKPLPPQNIVIGGAAGAVPPLVGWAAATGGVAPAALYLFAIVFYWTPPHFWALSLLMKDEYARVNVPMMPVVHGEAETRRQIVLYTFLLVAVTASPFLWGTLGLPYLVAALVLGATFFAFALGLRREATPRRAALLFHFSLLYLALLFAAMAADAAL